MLYDPHRSQRVDDGMAAIPEGGEWVQWITLAFSAIIAFLSGTGSAGFFAGRAAQEIRTLKERMDQSFADRDQLRVDLRDAVHDMRSELHKAIGASARADDIRRLEQHLQRQDAKLDDRFTEVVRLLVNGRRGGEA